MGVTTKRKYITNYECVLPLLLANFCLHQSGQAIVVKISGKGRKSHLVAIVKGEVLSDLTFDVVQVPSSARRGGCRPVQPLVFIQ